jgi:hypothetical protein
MICKYGFYTCVNCTYEIQSMCDNCTDGDNYEIDDNLEIENDETETMQDM